MKTQPSIKERVIQNANSLYFQKEIFRTKALPLGG